MTVTAHNLDGYDAPAIEWERVREVLATDVTHAPGTGGPNRHTSWLTTIGEDGMPHVRPVGVVHRTGCWYFNSNPDTRKARNLVRDGRCVVSLATEPFDLVLEGTAIRVSDADELASVAEDYRRGGWPCSVEGDALTAEFSAPSGGPPPYHVFRVQPSRVYAFGTAAPYGATRFDL
jgi:hypothetical protein